MMRAMRTQRRPQHHGHRTHRPQSTAPPESLAPRTRTLCPSTLAHGLPRVRTPARIVSRPFF